MAHENHSSEDMPHTLRPPTAILETVVYCDDLDAAKRFYEGVLSLQLVSAEPDRHLFFRVGSSMLLVFNPEQTRTATVRVGDAEIPRHGADGQSHMAFQVRPSELETIASILRQHNIEIESRITWPGGGQSIYCRDPSHNSIEFATRSLWFENESDAGDRSLEQRR